MGSSFFILSELYASSHHVGHFSGFEYLFVSTALLANHSAHILLLSGVEGLDPQKSQTSDS